MNNLVGSSNSLQNTIHTEFYTPPAELEQTCPSVPQSFLQANRNELTNIALNITQVGKKEFPKDLKGHVFIIAPVGTVTSGGLPLQDGGSFLNGDGMVYRLDFKKNGQVLLTTRIIKPPDYYADRATSHSQQYAKYQFRSHGIIRFSPFLGSRNDLSIGFLPFKFAEDLQERLLVTYDAGRHYEINTETLEVVTPIGKNKEWRGATKLNFPFQPVLTTAHPVFDSCSHEMFTVNYGRSLHGFFGFLSNLPFAKSIRKFLKQLKTFFSTFLKIFKNLHLLEDFVYLIRWNGRDDLERWRLVLDDGSSVKIKQCIHQIGVSQDYIILMDTSFKFELWQAINNPFSDNKTLARFLRKMLDRPMQPRTTIYIVPRDRLQTGERPLRDRQEVKVVATKVELPLESTHFLVDRENPQNQITLHAVHTCAWDVGEWIRKYDVSAYPPHNPVPERLCGMEQSEMDISRLGRYVIDGETGKLVEQKVIPEVCDRKSEDFTYAWGVALYTHLARLPSLFFPSKSPEKIDNIYWVSLGLWKDLVTQFMCDLYRDYKNRKIAIQDLLKIAEEEGRPSCLFRVDTSSTESMKVADCYKFPSGHIGLSPQFVPRGNGNTSTDGYVTCTVWFENNYEIWIFEAEDLSQGPLWKLSHPSLNFGLTLHAIWLPTIGKNQANYNIPVRQDYQDVIENFPYPPTMKKEIRRLFEEEIYPHFE